MSDKRPKGEPGPRTTAWRHPEAVNVKLTGPDIDTEPEEPNWEYIKSR